MTKNFYTAREAQQRLGINENSFYYLVRKGTIKKVTLPGKKQGVYPKSEIDDFAASIKTLIEQYERDTSVFEPATAEDLPAEVEIDMSLYGSRGTTPLEARLARLQANSQGNYVLKNSGKIVGHISFYPVETTTLKAIISGELHGAVPLDKILPFVQGQPLEVFIFIASVKPGFPPNVARSYGQRLIAGAVRVFRQLGERGIEITNIYATSRTSMGIRLCRKLGMKEEPVANERGRFRFSLNVQTSTSLLVDEYREGLAEYNRMHHQETLST